MFPACSFWQSTNVQCSKISETLLMAENYDNYPSTMYTICGVEVHRVSEIPLLFSGCLLKSGVFSKFPYFQYTLWRTIDNQNSVHTIYMSLFWAMIIPDGGMVLKQSSPSTKLLMCESKCCCTIRSGILNLGVWWEYIFLLVFVVLKMCPRRYCL